MEELVLASYIKIMQEGFVEKTKQESATRFLLDSVISQEAAGCTTDIDSKKISNLANRKISVPEDISLASSKAVVIDGTREYFADKIMKELNPNTLYDTLKKIHLLIVSDPVIAELKVKELSKLYESHKFDHFLADTFLYVLGRENREKMSQNWKAQTRILYRSSVYSESDAMLLVNELHVCVFPHNGNIVCNQIYRLEEYCSFESDFDDDGKRVVCGSCSIDDFNIVGETSSDNWVSKSYRNNIVKSESVFCKVWLKVLEVTDKNCRVQFLIIGDEI